MKLYREWASTTNHRVGGMMPLKRIEDMLKSADPGYASVYAFDENAAREILASRASQGFNRYDAYADTLTIDLDADTPEGALEKLSRTEAILAGEGLGYAVWFSGGKGYHVVLKQDALCKGRNVPYSQRKWVEGREIPGDMSLYQHGRILSLPGRVHPRTRVRKHLVKEVSGMLLTLPLVEAPEIVFNYAANGGLSELEAGLLKLIQLIGNEPPPGNRHTGQWSTAKHLADAGLPYEVTLGLLLHVNADWNESKDDEAVELAVSQAYGGKP